MRDYYMENTNPAKRVNPQLNLFAPVWVDTLDPTEMTDYQHTGFIEHRLIDELYIVSLNTVPYSVRELSAASHP